MQSKLFFLVLPLVGTTLALPVDDAAAAPAVPEVYTDAADAVKDVNLADINYDDVLNEDDVGKRTIVVKKAAMPAAPKKMTTTTKKPTPTPVKKPTPTPSPKKKSGLGSACTVM